MPRSVFVEDGVKAGCLRAGLGGREPPRVGPHPDVLLTHIKPLGRHLPSKVNGGPVLNNRRWSTR